MSVETVVCLLVVVCGLLAVLEFRAEERRAREGAEALRELMKIAKRNDKEGRLVRLHLRAWATTPPNF